MKKLAPLLFLLTVPAWAGVTYEFQSASTGVANGVLSGKVAVDSGRVRMDMKSGDNFMFKENTFILSNDGGKTLSVYDPSARTYYIVNLQDLLGMNGGLLGSLGGMFSVNFSNPTVTVKDLGDGGTIEGYPTKHALVNAAYDIAIDAMGNKATTHITMSTELWSTDKLGAEYSNFLQAKGLRTGYPELDKLIETQSGAINGRFPLKEVTTIHLAQNGGDITTTNTSTVSNIETKTLAASTFAAPAGYVKVDDPISRMMKNLK